MNHNAKNSLEVKSSLGVQYDTNLHKFQKLIPNRIREILFVASPYDSYLIEEDGLVYDEIKKEYQGLNLYHAPEVIHVSTAAEAYELLKIKKFDMIITTLHIKDIHAIKFAQALRTQGYKIPIVLLTYDNSEIKSLIMGNKESVFDQIFIWHGDYRLLVAIIKCMEDRLNVENDSQVADVQSIILIENSVRFYSLYLPIIYTEIFEQSQRLINEGLNLTHKHLRMRTRPKILLCTNYEEAWTMFEKYSKNILGVISDVNFKRNGVKDSEAGIHFVKAVKKRFNDVPVLLQSSNACFEKNAKELGVSFILKTSPSLLYDLRQFIVQNFGFGDFIFRLPDGTYIGQASNLKTLEEELRTVPVESIIYHGERNHFSSWLKARTELTLANMLRSKKVKDYETPEGLRNFLLNSLIKYRKWRTQGVITNYDYHTFDPNNSFCRIGGGSMGGKARGLGFVNNLLGKYKVDERFPNVNIFVPTTVVLGTEVFDKFLLLNKLLNFALTCNDDQEILKRFSSAFLPIEVTEKLHDLMAQLTKPLAVRSSSLLEDSQYQPFAGVYETYMLPNNKSDTNARLQDLMMAIKKVYASIFYQKSKDYIKATEYRLEEEKMAIVIQNIMGTEKNDRFYPDCSGVAKSHNFYPYKPQKASDGIAQIVLGLGKMVVDGGKTLRFCPKYPRHILHSFSSNETLKTAQQDFFALSMKTRPENIVTALDLFVHKYDLEDAEKDGSLIYSGSTYSMENNTIYDGISRRGHRLVTFTPVLQYDLFPLPEVLDYILELASWSMGTPVEIEFAVNLNVPCGSPREFALLQMRPLVLNFEMEELQTENIPMGQMLVKSSQVLGNGIQRNIYDAIVVDPDLFNRSESHNVAQEIAAFNTLLRNQERPYLLIGPGRWGTADPWLGIPVSWDQINGASAIVEASFKDFEVSPSQGSHFFQNITSFNISYFTVNSNSSSTIDWKFFKKLTPLATRASVHHFQFDKPLTIMINGYKGKGLITHPGYKQNL